MVKILISCLALGLCNLTISYFAITRRFSEYPYSTFFVNVYTFARNRQQSCIARNARSIVGKADLDLMNTYMFPCRFGFVVRYIIRTYLIEPVLEPYM